MKQTSLFLLTFVMAGMGMAETKNNTFDLEVKLTHLDGAGFDLAPTAFLEVEYIETRYIPLLTYERTSGHHGFWGTMLPRTKTLTLVAPITRNGEEAVFVFLKIKKQLFSLGGYEIKTLKLTYENLMNTSHELNFRDSSDKLKAYRLVTEIPFGGQEEFPPMPSELTNQLVNENNHVQIHLYRWNFQSWCGLVDAVENIKLTVNCAKFTHIRFSRDFGSEKGNSGQAHWRNAGWRNDSIHYTHVTSGALAGRDGIQVSGKAQFQLPYYIQITARAEIKYDAFLIQQSDYSEFAKNAHYPLVSPSVLAELKRKASAKSAIEFQWEEVKPLNSQFALRYLRLNVTAPLSQPWVLVVTAQAGNETHLGFCQTPIFPASSQ